jgi:hypothetical protein
MAPVGRVHAPVRQEDSYGTHSRLPQREKSYSRRLPRNRRSGRILPVRLSHGRRNPGFGAVADRDPIAKVEPPLTIEEAMAAAAARSLGAIYHPWKWSEAAARNTVSALRFVIVPQNKIRPCDI